MSTIKPNGTGLYLHFPWCERKCPYCDFNSHTKIGEQLPEVTMVQAMLHDLDRDIQRFGKRTIQTIFIGGGTPSLISEAQIGTLLEGAAQRLDFASDIEITMEANPGSSELKRFKGYRSAGVNRLSIGVQSFNPAQLTRLGRIHSSEEAQAAIAAAQRAGFDRINIDLMYGLEHQTPESAMEDVSSALQFDTGHISWYQLTIEPNTVFYKERPLLPDDDLIADIAEAGEQLLAENGYERYEVSAFSKPSQACRHNINYWQFGDYFGCGAGAHGKLSDSVSIVRTAKHRMPERYLEGLSLQNYTAQTNLLAAETLIAEFMLNALRLRIGSSLTQFEASTGLNPDVIAEPWRQLKREGLMVESPTLLRTTDRGWRFLNTVIERFLD